MMPFNLVPETLTKISDNELLRIMADNGYHPTARVTANGTISTEGFLKILKPDGTKVRFVVPAFGVTLM